MSDDNVLALPGRKRPKGKGPLTVVMRTGCHHGAFEVDDRAAEVTCGLCGEKLNPIWVLHRIATDDRVLRDSWLTMRAEMALLRERKRCKCEHCGKMTPVRLNLSAHALETMREAIRKKDSSE